MFIYSLVQLQTVLKVQSFYIQDGISFRGDKQDLPVLQQQSGDDIGAD